MSAIAGIYYPHGGKVDRRDLKRMMAILAHRGPDSKAIWVDGLVGLGQRTLWSTPESLHDRLPLVNETGKLVLTADARIDNRDELASTLGLANRSVGGITDSDLILAAYEKWGERCPEKLLGDFAFAIWDKEKQSLFCARDHFGVKPFYYLSSDKAFFFASEIKALLCLPEVPRRLNEVRVGEYLASMFDDTTITFYKDILRLSPAHSVTVTREGARLQRYWSLDSSSESRLDSDGAYAMEFRELFVEAVRCRLRSAFPVGSSLSGGLDSSSVSCVAQRLLTQNGGPRLHTFSTVFDKVTECDERPFIHAVLAQNGFEPHYIHGDQMGPLSHLDHLLWHEDEPFYAPGLFSTWRLYGAAKEQGVRVLLDGNGGDEVVSHGSGRLRELAQTRRWLTLVREAGGLARTHGESTGRVVWNHIRHYQVDSVIARHRTLDRIRRVYRAVRRPAWHGRTTDRPAWRSAVNRDFAERIDLAGRYRAWLRAQPGSARGEREMHYRTLTGGLQPFALEVLDKAAAAFSIELRHPFWDKRLVEFGLSLPSEQKLRQGWSRLVLRRAMEGFLPAKVQWRIDKMDFFPNFSHGLLSFEQERLEKAVLKGSDIIKEYVDIQALHEMYRCFVSRQSLGTPREVLTIWKAVSLALWLQYFGKGGNLYGHENKQETLHHA